MEVKELGWRNGLRWKGRRGGRDGSGVVAQPV